MQELEVSQQEVAILCKSWKKVNLRLIFSARAKGQPTGICYPLQEPEASQQEVDILCKSWNKANKRLLFCNEMEESQHDVAIFRCYTLSVDFLAIGW